MPANYNLIMKNYNRKEIIDGSVYYYLNSKFHRIDGPAIEYANGNKSWYQNNNLHRVDGPAIEFNNGENHWYQNDQLHRTDGPAIEHTNGYKSWFYYGEKIHVKSQKEFERYIKTLILI